ncbi:TonB-dependent receptor plug domain-containing protein [Sulfurovum mangrovi]|uniref:TonB-dependent receptor plug domain-containing protein n=1 Tax=Sulfurovum mangrovi TaxID=2893889 RepID=UPI001E546FD2|nr:TonB-dependent receptor plug domain-containing protein [Sulfurovum mangrovi]UFH58021.1 TonB-dependent receptor plug domain-containing protein [Sulfurovum mangrovi]
MKIKYLSLITATLLTSALDAQTTELDAVDVEADISARDDLKLESSTNLYKIQKSTKAGTEVLTQKEIEAYNPKDLIDLLNKATGIDLSYHGRRSPFDLKMRGSSNITYIVDGAILPPAATRMLYKFPLIAIEEIQIVRSATALSIAPSINVGASNSSSGVNIGYIIIRTKQPKKTEGIFSAFIEKAVSQPTANGQTLYAGTRFGESDSWNGYLGAMVSRFDRKSKSTWFDGTDSNSGMVNGGVNNGRFNLNFMAYKDSGRLEMQRGVKHDGTLDNAKWYYDPVKTTLLSLDGSMIWSEGQVTLFSLAHTEYEQLEHNENFASDAASTREYEEKTQSYSLRHNATFGDTTFRFGGQYVTSDGVGSDLYNPYKKYDTSIMGASASVEQSLLDGDLVVDAGYRWDQKHIKDSTAAKSEALASPEANNDVDLAPASIITLGAVYNILDTQILSARYFYGDQGVSGDFTLQTQDGSRLDPEKQTRYEISLESKFDRAFHSLITYFDTNIENEKRATSNTYLIDGEEYYYYQQVNSHTKGVEVTLKGNIATSTNYKFSWTRILSKKTEDFADVKDEVGVIVPEDTFTVMVSHKWEDYLFSLSGKKVSGYTSSKSPMGLSDADLGDYTRFDANVARSFEYNGMLATAKLYGRNLTNNHYATKYTTGYYYDRGRTLGLEVTLQF